MDKMEKKSSLKQGVLAVSFGTTHEDAEKKSIASVEDAIRGAFAGFEVRRAFTSKMVLKKLAERGRAIPEPASAVKEMADDGFTRLIVQPLLLMKGHEYEEKIVAPLKRFQNSFESFVIGEPLLTGTDLGKVIEFARLLSDSVGNERILFMGHGSDHPSDAVFGRIQEGLDREGINADIATVEGAVSLDDVLPRLRDGGISRVHLFPFMLVAGDHAKNDMAGDEDDSWKSRLESEGIEAVPHLSGLGESPLIRNIFVSHVQECGRKIFPEEG